MPAKAVDVETYSHLNPDSSTQASTCPPSTNRDGDGIHPTKPGRRRGPGPGVHLRFPLPIGSLTHHATAHAGTSTVHATPAGARASH